jgi:hypothetical protein
MWLQTLCKNMVQQMHLRNNSKFTIDTTLERIKKKGELFAEIDSSAVITKNNKALAQLSDVMSSSKK